MIKLIKSTFYNDAEIKKHLAEFIKKCDRFSMGRECKKFEKNFAEKQRRKFAVFVSSGSSANLILIQSLLNLGVMQKGNKIGFSSLTWSTNVMPLLQLGLKPVALDCNKTTLNVSSQILEKNIRRLKGLFLTNVLGFCDDIERIKDICDTNNLIFIEDNCESLGSGINGKLLGNFGLASTFSFFVGHHISTIEGGMVCTDNEELYHMLIMVRAHGWDRNHPEAKQKKLRNKLQTDDFFAKYIFYDLSYNARPTEIGGFLGNLQLRYWDEIVKSRENNYQIFKQRIKSNSDFIPLILGHMDIISNFAVPVVCKTKKIFEKYKKRFLSAEVEIRPIIAGNICKQPFFKKYIKTTNSCHNADFIHNNGFYFGNNPELTKGEINLICNLLK